MPRFFARLYLDEDVDVLVADLVRSQGFAVTTAHDEDMLGASDLEQLAFAVERERLLVTHNRRDFERLAVRYFEGSQTHWGIVCAVRRPPHDLATRLVHLVNEHMASELKNQVMYI